MFLQSLKYLLLTIKHKWFVFLAGIKIKVPLWNLIIHDWSKFTLSELPHYGRQFFGEANDPKGFITCWIHHQNFNKHHWEYWVPRTGHSRCTPPYLDNNPIPMPEKYVREMVADWMGASRAYEGTWPDVNNWKWVEKNVPKMNLHDETKLRLYNVFYNLNNNIKYSRILANLETN